MVVSSSKVRNLSTGTSKYSYDPVGKRLQMRDPRGSLWQYQCYPENLLKRLDISSSDGSVYHVEYTYDAAGNRTRVRDNGNINNYVYDELNRITGAERNFDSASYRTGYQYTKALLTGIQYPGSTSLLQYRYDNFNRVSEVVGFTKPQGITYYADDAVQNITYTNGTNTSFTYDNNRRLQDLISGTSGQNILKQHYEYDATNNITNINDKLYEYDSNNQLTKAVTPGKFLETKITPGSPGVVVGDYLGSSNLYFGGNPQAIVKLDYDSSSIGIDFGGIAPGVKKILLVPDKDHSAHRITQGTFDIYYSNDNSIYTLIPREQWEFARDASGVITVTLKQKLATRYLKIHVLFDHRDPLFKPKDKATFLNTFAKMLQIYQESDSQTEEYSYDGDGNRKFSRITLIQATENESLYYPNSDRLKTDGKYLYSYDNAGNLVSKERTNLQEGETAEKWQYQYDLLNRLIRVTKDGTIVSEYEYDPEGLRVVKKAKGQTIHYVFEGTEPIFEKNTTTGKTKSYIYALGKHLARVDGVIGDPDAKVYWYTTDHLGSVKAVTDNNGKVVFQADHLAFGQRYGETGNFEEWHSFTGKEFDPETGLYYFNARWYDAETGRFISEDSVNDPNNPNLYVYGANNPLVYNDPSGHWNEDSKWYKPWTWFNKSDSSNGNNTNKGSSNNSTTNNNQSGKTTSENPTAPSAVKDIDYSKIDDAYKQLKQQFPDYKDIDHEKLMKYAKENGLSDAERLYLAARVAQDNPNYNKGFRGDPPVGWTNENTTWCNAYAADVLYLFSGDKSLMNSSADPVKHNNFYDPTDGWTLATTDKTGKNGPSIAKELSGDGWDQLKDTKKLTDEAQAQNLANQGRFVVAFTDGHIAVIVPGKMVNGFPNIAQQGKHGFISTPSAPKTTANGWPANAIGEVKYYVIK